MDWNTRAIEDLYLEPSDDSLDDDEPIYCVLSKELDAVTFVDAAVGRRHPLSRQRRLAAA